MLRFFTGEWEKDLVRQAEHYLHQTFGIATQWQSAPREGLPNYLTDRYRFWRGDLLGRHVLFMAPGSRETPGIDEMAHQVQQARSRLETAVVILVFAHLATARRNVLISQGLAFLVPGNQLFVPDLLLDLRERTPFPPRTSDVLSPTAQMVTLGALLGKPADGHAADFAKRYGVAPMSMTRALDELEVAGLAQAPKVGRERMLRFTANGRALWDRAAPRLQTPVRKLRTVIVPWPDQFPAKLAGETALAHYTDLNAPRMRRLAVASADWNRLVRDHDLQETESLDPRAEEVETWSYDPVALASGTTRFVDPLSLYLSTRGHPDERVAGAAQNILEAMPWW